MTIHEWIKKKTEFLTLKHYKEPLIKVSSGYGYYGAISITMDGEKIQCHKCGKLFKNLSMHIFGHHKQKVSEYREEYQLARSTALVSEAERFRMKESFSKMLLEKYPTREAFLAHMKEIGKAGIKMRMTPQPKQSLETWNKRGTCPEQLIDKIKKVAEKLGRTPSLSEFITETGGQRYKHLIFKVYGSWKNALNVAKLKPRERVKEYKSTRWSKDELLDLLSLFAQENNKIPTETDAKRGLIPNSSTYKRHFGGIEKARELAGVYDFVPRERMRGYVNK